MGDRYVGQDGFGDDGLFIDSETSFDEVAAFVQHRVERPIEIGDKTIWNLSSFDIDREALDRSIKGKQHDSFVIPFQVTGTWGVMFHLLPSAVRNAEILVYQPGDNGRPAQYAAYRNFYRARSAEEFDAIRRDLARRVRDTLDD